MNRYNKQVEPVLWLMGYLAAFVPFAMTSVFGWVESLSGSPVAALLIINGGAAVVIFLANPLGVRAGRILPVLSGLYGLSVVFSYSRLDWLKRILGLNFTCSLPEGVAALCLLISLTVNLWTWNRFRWVERCRQWEENGASAEAAEQVYKGQKHVFQYLLGAIAAFAVVAASAGLLVLRFKQGVLQPVWVLMMGLILLGGCIVYLVVMVRKMIENQEVE